MKNSDQKSDHILVCIYISNLFTGIACSFLMMMIHHFCLKDKDAKQVPGPEMNSTHVVVLEMKYGTRQRIFEKQKENLNEIIACC